jgi:hypothetical protein
MVYAKKKPIVIQAHQWFKNGDHPKDDCELLKDSDNITYKSEGKLVRYYRNPEINGNKPCKHCGHLMHNHGWVDTLEGGHIVCVGDWVITGFHGEHYPIKDNIFKETYETVDDLWGDLLKR